jgi:hypothetical protein
MASFDVLVLNVEHPWDTVERGDAVQIETGGFFANGGYRQDVFAVLTVDLGDINLKQAKRYTRPLYEENGEIVIAKKYRKYRFDMDSITLDENNKATLGSLQEVLSVIIEKEL